MRDMLKILDPRGEAIAHEKRSYPTLDTIAGKTMVVLNNGWTCMDEIAEYLGNALKSRYGVARVVSFPVPTGVAADPSVLRAAAEVGDFVAVGLAN